MLDTNLKNLQILLSTMETDHLSRSEFTDAFKQVIDFVKAFEAKKDSEIQTLKETLKTLGDKLAEKTDLDIKSISEKSMKYCMEEMDKMMTGHSSKMSEVDKKMSEMKDGKDADEEMMCEKVSEMVKEPIIEAIESSLPELGESMRDGLELLQGDERLDVSAIKGLEELLKENKSKVVGGGGFNYSAVQQHFVDDETPVGAIDDNNKDFLLNHAPSPISSLKVYKGGARQRITVDYTLSNKTITFNDAPETGSIILVDYRF